MVKAYWPPPTKGELEQCRRDWERYFGHLGASPAGTEMTAYRKGFILVSPGDPPKLNKLDGTVEEIKPDHEAVPVVCATLKGVV